MINAIYSVNVSTVVMALGAVDPEGTELGMAVVYVNNNNIGYWKVRTRMISLTAVTVGDGDSFEVMVFS